MKALRHELPAPLAQDFYARRVDVVARALLGCYVVNDVGEAVGGRIVETEAYGGPDDPGSHSARSPNGRAQIMFGRPGVAYVYFTYGMHHCLNAVTDRAGRASAVLIRALEPVWGVERMRAVTNTKLPDALLCSGPGRVCRALGIDRTLNGCDLVEGPVRILAGERTGRRPSSGPRVGLSRDDGRLWRFWIPSASVSRSGSRRPDR